MARRGTPEGCAFVRIRARAARAEQGGAGLRASDHRAVRKWERGLGVRVCVGVCWGV